MSTFWVQPPHSHHTSNQMMPFSTFNNSMTYPSAVIKGMASCGGSSRSTSSSSSGGHGLRIDSMALYNKANNRNHQSYRQSAAAPPPAVNNNGHNNNLSAGNMYSMRPPLPMMMTTSQRPGSSCSIASNSSADGSVAQPPPPPLHNRNYQESRYKIEMCRHWEEKGNCPHGHQCLFAHGVHELRPFRGRHRKFKTQLCKAFHSDGFCSFGPRCSYIHSPDEVVATQEGLITVTEMAAKAVIDVNATGTDQQQQQQPSAANCMTTSINDYHMMANTVAVADSISTTIATDLSRLTLSSSSSATTTTSSSSRQLSSSVANSLSSASSSGSSSSTTSGGRHLSSPVDDIGCQSAAVDDLYTRYRLSVFANMCHN